MGAHMTSARAGAIADPGAYGQDIKAGAIIARHERITNSSTTTTEVGVLQIEGVVMKNGRAYWVGTPPIHVQGGAADVVALRIRYTTDGTTAGTSSTVLRYEQTTIRTGTPDEPIQIGEWYFPTSDQTLSILLTVARVAGTAAAAFVVGASDRVIRLTVEDRGEDPGATGISL